MSHIQNPYILHGICVFVRVCVCVNVYVRMCIKDGLIRFVINCIFIKVIYYISQIKNNTYQLSHKNLILESFIWSFCK